MKKVLLIIGVITLLIGCSTPKDNSQSNVILIEKYVQAVENLDYQTMEDLLDEKYIGLGPSINDSIGKIDAIKNWKSNVKNLYKNIDYNKSRNIAVHIPDGENKGEWVSNWAELTIVYQSEEQATIWVNTVYKMENGKIVPGRMG